MDDHIENLIRIEELQKLYAKWAADYHELLKKYNETCSYIVDDSIQQMKVAAAFQVHICRDGHAHIVLFDEDEMEYAELVLNIETELPKLLNDLRQLSGMAVSH